MSSVAPSAAPPNALLVWADHRSIYVQLRYSSGAPYILSFPRSEGGLSKALALLCPPPTDTGGPPLLRHPGPINSTAAGILKGLKVI